jgi:mRNA interferase RelE/StbE
MTFSVIFHPEAAKEIARLDADTKERLKNAIIERLMTEPSLYGKPLRGTLRGYWKLRVGDYRVVFGMDNNDIIVYAVCHRKKVYQLVKNHLG